MGYFGGNAHNDQLHWDKVNRESGPGCLGWLLWIAIGISVIGWLLGTIFGWLGGIITRFWPLVLAAVVGVIVYEIVKKRKLGSKK